MTDTFTWIPDDGPSGEKNVRANILQFGDGYKQIIGDGLNTLEQSWSLTFNRDYSEIDAIEDFLVAHSTGTAGPVSFFWTPPGPNAVQGYYFCLSWRVSPRSGQNATLSATFEQAFFP